jgi:hypothetical protein
MKFGAHRFGDVHGPHHAYRAASLTKLSRSPENHGYKSAIFATWVRKRAS